MPHFSLWLPFLCLDTCLPRTPFATCCMVLLHVSHSSCTVFPPQQGSSSRLSSSLSHTYLSWYHFVICIYRISLFWPLMFFMFDIGALILAIPRQCSDSTFPPLYDLTSLRSDICLASMTMW